MRALDHGRSGLRALEAAGLGHVRDFLPTELVPTNGVPGQHVALITGGLVKVTLLDTESRAPETLLSIRGRWDLIGEETVILDEASTATGYERSAGRLMVTALTFGSARVFPADQLRRFLHEHPAVLWPIAAALCERLVDAEARIASAASDNADRRLARLLCDLERHGRPENEYPDSKPGLPTGTRIPLDLSHAELASWIGSCRDTVSRILTRWRRREIISTGYRTIVVHDLGTLARIAGVQVHRRTWNWTGPPAV